MGSEPAAVIGASFRLILSIKDPEVLLAGSEESFQKLQKVHITYLFLLMRANAVSMVLVDSTGTLFS